LLALCGRERADHGGARRTLQGKTDGAPLDPGLKQEEWGMILRHADPLVAKTATETAIETR